MFSIYTHMCITIYRMTEGDWPVTCDVKNKRIALDDFVFNEEHGMVIYRQCKTCIMPDSPIKQRYHLRREPYRIREKRLRAAVDLLSAYSLRQKDELRQHQQDRRIPCKGSMDSRYITVTYAYTTRKHATLLPGGCRQCMTTCPGMRGQHPSMVRTVPICGRPAWVEDNATNGQTITLTTTNIFIYNIIYRGSRMHQTKITVLGSGPMSMSIATSLFLDIVINLMTCHCFAQNSQCF